MHYNKTMKIACIQFEPLFGRVEENIRRMTALVAAAKADVLVMPELATSGYLFETRDDALACAEDPADAPSADAIARALADTGALAAVYGFVEKDGDVLYNSAAVVTPDGIKTVYRKIHLFDTEKEIFAPGAQPFPVVEVGEVMFGVMICFDWIYPESARSLAVRGADVICHPANLVLPWCQESMLTRSIENGVYTATANRVGTETRGGKTLAFTGMSQVTDPAGTRLAQAGKDTEEIITAEINPALSRDKLVTPHNDLLRDRRPDLYFTT